MSQWMSRGEGEVREESERGLFLRRRGGGVEESEERGRGIHKRKTRKEKKMMLKKVEFFVASYDESVNWRNRKY